MTRRVFYSFHYQPDVFRVSQVRNIGALEANRPATDHDWETVTGGSDIAIKRWITGQMERRTCTVVLIGENTANRKWINHEITKSWEEGLGVVGIHIHGLKNHAGFTSNKGANPFEFFNFGDVKFSSIVKCYNPYGTNSKEIYDWISKNLEYAVEEAVQIRNRY